MDIVDISGNIHFGNLIENLHLHNLVTSYSNRFDFFREISNGIEGALSGLRQVLATESSLLHLKMFFLFMRYLNFYAHFFFM